MKTLLTSGIVLFVIAVSIGAQTGSTSGWEQGEREMFLGLEAFVRPNISEIGSIKDFFYDINRGYTIEQPVKTARGRYSIRCTIGSEYTDDKIYLTFNFVRSSDTGALIDSILLQNSNRPGQQVTASTTEEKTFILMQFFAAR